MAITWITGPRLRALVLMGHLPDRLGRERGDEVTVPVPLTHQMIARLVGAARSSVSTAMKELENEGALA